MQPPFSLQEYDAAASFIRSDLHLSPQVGLILGSGLNSLAEQIRDPQIIDYAQIPHFPTSTVSGHVGRLVIGELAGLALCAMQGRLHAYEGYTLAQTTFPVRVMQRLGIRTLLLTNAAGGINPHFDVGDLMVIEDHLNLPGMMGFNPLSGPNLDEFGVRFQPMNRTYTRSLRRLAQEVGQAQGLPMRHGVYAFLSGPTFESPAEVRFLRQIGVDAVGMSTVPEAIVASHAGMQVLAISTITNQAIDTLDSDAETSHQEVLDAGKVIVPRLSQLLLGILQSLTEILR